ncbi:MAG: YkgJ family cysteine cluster protein [Synergistaceae bacterium]|nr:YkgJ family cysteine cluster protein [Synergistaceae bacterium]
MYNFNFRCRKCGECCTYMKALQNNIPDGFEKFRDIAIELDSGDGVCKYLDRNSRLCKIYESRPAICNYELFFEMVKDELTPEQFDEILNDSCEIIRNSRKIKLK